MRIKKAHIILSAALALFISSSAVVTSGKTDRSAEPSNTDQNDALVLSPRHSYELTIINRLLQQFHYLEFDLDDAFSRKILDSYLDELDPNRLFFIEQDITEFRKLQDNFDDYIRGGVVEPAYTIFDIYLTRVNERIDFALRRLVEPFDFELHETYTVDRREALWAADKTTLNDIWRKRIKNDLISQELSDKPAEEALETLTKRYNNIARRAEQIKADDLFQLIANSYANALEPHTSYFSPRASEEFNIHMRLSLEGIGAVLRGDGEYTRVMSVVPGGPADLSGFLDAGDRIVGVAQGQNGEMVDIVGWRLSDVVDIIRGKKGTQVSLNILPSETGLSGNSERIVITRDNIKLENQAAQSRIIDVSTATGQSKVGVIDLPSFYIDFDARSKGDPHYRSTTRDVAKLINEMQTEEIDGLIIDLRGNGGGALDEAISLTGLFIDQGPVVQVHDSDGRVKVHKDNDKGLLYDGPLMVMVDRSSASASEIFAGAIQDYRRGLIIGEPTFGKGTVQNVLPLSIYARDKFRNQVGQVKITIAQFFRVNGDSTQHRGVIPDLSWPLPVSEDDIGERAYDNAIPWKHIDSARYAPYAVSINPQAFSRARETHASRTQSDLEYLSTLMKMRLLADSRNEREISLNLGLRQSKRELLNERLLEVENAIRKANDQPTFENIEALQADTKEREFSQDDDSIDVFLREASNILSDYRVFVQENSPAPKNALAIQRD